MIPPSMGPNIELADTTKKTITDFYGGNNVISEKAQNKITEFVVNIINEKSIKFDLSNLGRIRGLTLEMAIEWIKGDLEEKHYTVKTVTDFVQKGELFINDKSNSTQKREVEISIIPRQ
jgi:hypothetical protein